VERYEIKITGVGGQGIRLAGVILGIAATFEGKAATHWQSYGVEARGGPSTSDVVISSGKIDYPRVISADVLVALDQAMLNVHLNGLKSGGILIIDSDLVRDKPKRDDILIRQIPMARIADTLGRRILINMIVLGVLTATTEIVSKHDMAKTIAANVPESSRDFNLKAFEEGLKLGEKAILEGC